MITSFFVALVLVVVGAGLARLTPVPDAVFWAALGFAAAFVPGFPLIRFDPKIALLVFLPPLVYASAVDLPWPEFRDNLRSILILAVGLVLATAALVAAMVHQFLGVPWAGAAVLGAVVSPTDPVAATAVAARVGAPRRLIAILEGEGLVNDGMALTIFALAVQAVATGRFSIGHGLERFAAIVILEPVYGWLVGVVIAWLRTKIEDPHMEIAVSLLTPFAAYLPPELLGGSGILATVATGMYIGERRLTMVAAGTRLYATSFWSMIVFLLNGGLFVIAGMELERVVTAPSSQASVLEWGLAVAGGVVAVRLLWIWMSRAALRVVSRVRRREPGLIPLRQIGILGWSAIRGPISLAAALSIPAVASEKAFPGNADLAVYITAVVVIATLLPQGLTLASLVRRLGVTDDAQAEIERTREDERYGAAQALASGLLRLEEIERERRVSPQAAERVRRYYENLSQTDCPDGLDAGAQRELIDVLSDLIDAERARVLELRRHGRLSDEALRTLERRLDLRKSELSNRA